MFIKQNNFSKDLYFMNLALMQAKKNLGKTKKNPSVGCVLVKNDNIIKAGATSLNGRPHAEFNVLNSFKKNLNNHKLYVTLEPCFNYGKTPPCADLIIKKKINHVFISINDPDKKTYFKTLTKFKKKNIITKVGVLKLKTKKFYESYFVNRVNGTPFVTAKLALSKDFFTINKKKEWITNKYSRGRVHLMRSKHDVILSSYKTVMSDNSHLTCRINGLEKFSPTRIILDKNFKISPKCNLIKSAKNFKTIIFIKNKKNYKKLSLFKKLKVKVIYTKTDVNGNFVLKNILEKINDLGYSRIFLESGISLISNFLKNGLINDFFIFFSNNKLNNNGDGNFKKIHNKYLKHKKNIKENVNLFNDTLISYKIK